MARLCGRVEAAIGDEKKLPDAFSKATDIANIAAGKGGLTRTLTKTLPFTEKFKKALLAKYPVA